MIQFFDAVYLATVNYLVDKYKLVLYKNVDWGKEEYDDSTREMTDDIEEAEIVTSMCQDEDAKHIVALDIDFPVYVVPSTTPGHNHLYIEKKLTKIQLTTLLQTLAEVGIIEEGYRDSSIKRGYTCLRLPWIKKKLPSSYRKDY